MKPRSSYHFGNFELRTAERRLLHKGVPINLPRKTYEVLLFLLENRGDAIAKHDFFDRIWPQTFIEEGSLTVNISLLRKLLAQFDPGSQYIETIPRVGYRFVNSVNAETTQSKAENPKRFFQRSRMTMLAATTCFVVGVTLTVIAFKLVPRTDTRGEDADATVDLLVLSDLELAASRLHEEVLQQVANNTEARDRTLELSPEIVRFENAIPSTNPEKSRVLSQIDDFLQMASNLDRYRSNGERSYRLVISEISHMRTELHYQDVHRVALGDLPK